MIGARCRAPPWEGTSTLPIEIRRRACRLPGCRKIFFICRSCDHGRCYCCDDHRHEARLEQRRKGNRKYQESRAAKLDHAARQREYIQRQKQKVTGQGREGVPRFVKIDSCRSTKLNRSRIPALLAAKQYYSADLTGPTRQLGRESGTASRLPHAHRFLRVTHV